MTRIAINGFGRIGRLILRIMAERNLLGQIPVVAVNDLVAADNLAYLLRYDSNYGRFPLPVQSAKSNPNLEKDDLLEIGGHTIRCLEIKEGPAAMPWADLGVDLVLEATGLFTSAERARGHLKAGASTVIITAPGKDADITVVYGVNHREIDRSRHAIISNASCTTNGLTPVVYVLLKEGFGVEEGLMTTVHSATASQKIQDGPSRKDWRGGRAVDGNIIPASTGAAKATALVLPEVKGKLTGMSFRIPTPTVSVVDLTVRTTKATSYEEICAAMKRASETYLAGVLGYTEDAVVSRDFLKDSRSSIFDASAGIGLNSHFFKLIAWYDNEWGYANRCVDLVHYLIRST
ncbi:Glyceraldehyde-3-phosphate dehydrogenase [Methylacidimicrobium sp. AP8]|uniref:type I glyceraldehyde-3-phosphate dehydrogenase n=1 Tax=Methylacidimicrobium sp. AP8 TaxID=2730359 RepID=UPI0018C00F08|nr:type I glyceraldehyde-3-phosphate dehydrogenase [Methylacidimicrobium sp. AP8]CAB4243480.1 Glyceraldehyde-3-phosphate dehydrogenase [Methylacidimicrobium sp. AP8]